MLDFLKPKKTPAAPAVPVTPQTPLIIDCSVRSDVNLGDMAKDKVTNFTGIVVAVSYEIDGTIFIGLQPRELDNGKPAEALDFDIERVEVTEAGMAKTHDTETVKRSVKIGAIYRDRVSGATGTAIRRIDFLGGCTRVTLQGKVGKDNKRPEAFMVPVESLEIVDEKPAEIAKEKVTKTGGPGSTDQKMLARMNAR